MHAWCARCIAWPLFIFSSRSPRGNQIKESSRPLLPRSVGPLSLFSTTARDRSSRPQLSAAGGRSPSPDHLLQSRRQIRNLLRALSPPIPNSRAVVAGSQRLSPSFSATVFEPSSLPCGPVGRTGAPPASCPRPQTCSTPRCRRGCRLGKAWAAQAAAGTSAALGMGARRGLPAPARRVL
jgi:hypothetical protein